MKRILFSGLMLMSFFFGAGNLIFAPLVGLNSGTFFGSALTGFTLTAVLIPFAAIVAVTISGDSALSFAGRVSKWFGLAYSVILILSIGPLFAIPRVANVSYNLGLAPLVHDLPISSIPGLIFIAIFFALSYFLALYGDKLVDTIGKYLSPALLIFIILLVICFLTSGHKETIIAEQGADYTSSLASIGKGAVDGYGTLDALAAVCFASLIVGAISPAENATKKEILSGVFKAGFISCFLLAVIYVGLAYIGNISADAGKTSGADLLSFAAEQAFGGLGQYVFGIIVFLACLTTSVGVLKTVSDYSSYLFGYSNQFWLIVFTISSAFLSVQGLDSVIKTSVPMIYFTYPITIALICITLFNPITRYRVWVYRFAMIAVVPFALADGVKYFYIMFGSEQPLDILAFLRPYIPFAYTDFSWVIPFFIAVALGFLMPKRKVHTYRLEHIQDARMKKYDDLLNSDA